MSAPNRVEGKIWMPNETSPQRLAIASPAKDYLLTRGVRQELLAETPDVVLTLPSHWLQGVVLLGNTSMDIAFNNKYSFPKTVNIGFITPEDQVNRIRGHFLRFTDRAPIVKGKDLLDGIGTSADKIAAGIQDEKISGLSAGSLEHTLSIPKELEKQINPKKRYKVKAILIDIENKTHERLSENLAPVATSFLDRGILLVTELIPIEKQNPLSKFFQRKSVLTPVK